MAEGPPGSERATTIKGICARRQLLADLMEIVVVGPGTPWAIIDTALMNGTDVLLRRVENIPATEADQLTQLIARHRTAWSVYERSSALFLTASRDHACEAVGSQIDSFGTFGTVVRTRPLAATPERIPGLVKSILQQTTANRRPTISPAALQSCVQYSWPGNTAELVETITTVAARVLSPVIERKHLPIHLRQAPPRRALSMIQTVEREAIIQALDAARDNKSEAAKLLGIGRTTLYRRLRQLGINSSEASL